MSKEKKISIGLLLIVFGIILVLVSTSSDYLETLAIFLLIGGGGFFGSSITSKD